MLLAHPNCEVINISERDFRRTVKALITVRSLNTLLDQCPCPWMILDRSTSDSSIHVCNAVCVCYLNKGQRGNGRKAERCVAGKGGGCSEILMSLRLGGPENSSWNRSEITKTHSNKGGEGKKNTKTKPIEKTKQTYQDGRQSVFKTTKSRNLE